MIGRKSSFDYAIGIFCVFAAIGTVIASFTAPQAEARKRRIVLIQKNWLDYAIGATSLFAAIGAIAAAGFAGWQAWIAKDTAKRQLRAYVFLENSGIRLINGETNFEVHVRMKNFGQTPAYKFTFWLIYDLKPIPSDTVKQRPGESILGPSGMVNKDVVQSFPQGKLKEIRENATAFFIWTGADYTDAFGTRHSFFCRLTANGPELYDQIDGQPWRGWPLIDSGCAEE